MTDPEYLSSSGGRAEQASDTPEDEANAAAPPTRHRSDSLAVDTQSDAEPIPPRFWWLKRLALAGVCVVVGLVLLRVWWGYHAQSLLDAEIARYRAAGQLVYAHEFDEMLDAIPDEENAALAYEEALTLYTNTAAPTTFDYWMTDPYCIAENPEPVRKMVEAYAPVFELIEDARGRDRVNWSTDLTSVATAPASVIFQARGMGKLLTLRAAWQIHTGDHAGAIASIGDGLDLGEAVEADPYLIASMIGWACRSSNHALICEVSPILSVAREGDVNADDNGTASRRSVEALIARLLEDSKMRESARLMLLGERAVNFSFLDLVEESPSYPPPGERINLYASGPGRLLWPLVQMETVRFSRRHTDLADAVAYSNWPEAAEQLALHMDPPTFISELSQPLSRILRHAPYRGLNGFFRLLSQRRQAAIALAIRLYEIDHGARPTTLDQLVPVYLAEVPIDPLSPNGARIGFLPDAEPPILYSVGWNGVDDGGRPRPPLDDQRSEAWDFVYYLGPNPNDDGE